MAFRKQRRPTGDLGRMIRTMRRRLNLNQQEFAALLGWFNGTVCMYELGRVNPSIPRLLQLLRLPAIGRERVVIVATLEAKGLSASDLALIASPSLIGSPDGEVEPATPAAPPSPETGAGAEEKFNG